MARTLTPQDAYALMNLLVKQATGQQNVTVTDLSSFVSAGETVLSTGMENVINSLSIVLNRTIVASRPYKSRLDLMEQIDTGAYSGRLRKISFYAKKALPSGQYNTNLFTNLKDGYTAGPNGGDSTRSQWEQHQPEALEMNFSGCSTWQDCVTIYEDQLKIAFRGPEEFNAFVSGYLTEHANDIESQREAWNRMNMLNKIASVYDTGNAEQKINLTAAFNSKFGTNYTSAQLRTTYLKDFLAFFVSEFKLNSKFMTERTDNYHNPMTKTVSETDPVSGETVSATYEILRHTPYNRQRIYLYSPLFTEAEALVLPEIFNPEYLDINTQYQEVTYWQGVDSRAEINVTPAVYDTATGTQKAGNAVNIPYVVGMIADIDALMTNWQVEVSRSTPVEARKGYRNVWTTFLRNNINDPTENTIIFYMEDPVTPEPEPEPEHIEVELGEGTTGLTLTVSTEGTDAPGGVTVYSGTLTGEVPYALATEGIYNVPISVSPETATCKVFAGDGPSATETSITVTDGVAVIPIDSATYVSGDITVQFAIDGEEVDIAVTVTLGEAPADDNQNGEPVVGD